MSEFFRAERAAAEREGRSVYDVTNASLGFGAVTGAAVGVGIAAAASLGHRLFAGQGLVVWAIEVGGDILGLTLMGLVLAFFY